MTGWKLNPISVLQVPHVYLPKIGGVQYYTLNLSKYLTSKGINVNILSTWKYVRTWQQDFYGIKTIWTPGFPHVGGNPLSPKLFLKLVKYNHSFDLYHAHPPQLAATFYSAIVRKYLSKKPLIITSHGFATSDYFSRKMRSLLRFANVGAFKGLRSADAIISLTNFEKKLLTLFAGESIEEKTQVIPNATDITSEIVRPYTKDNSRTKLGYKDQFIILFIGMLRWQKGVQYLIESVRQLKNTNFLLLVVGDGEQKQELMKLVPENFAKRIIFTGTVTKPLLYDFYSACNVVALPSLHEGFPTIVPEAWMFSKPVILTKIPTHEEIISKNGGGILVKSRSTRELSKTFQYLIDNPDIQRKLGYEGKKAAVKNYSWQKVGAGILKLYKKVLGI